MARSRGEGALASAARATGRDRQAAGRPVASALDSLPGPEGARAVIAEPSTLLQHYLRNAGTPARGALVGAMPSRAAPLPAPAGHAGERRAGRRLRAPGLARPHRARERARRHVPGRVPRGQSRTTARCSAARPTRRCRPIGKPVDLAVIVAPPRALRDILEDGAKARLRAAIVLTDPPATDPAAQRRWTRDVAQLAAKRGIRLVGPGRVRRRSAPTSASTRRSPTSPSLPGRLALVAQSGAVCTAMLDFAAPMRHRLLDGDLARRRASTSTSARLLDCAAARSGDRRHPALRRERCGDARALPVRAARRGAHQAGRRAEGRALARDPRRALARARRPTRCSTRRCAARAPCACAPTRSSSPPRASSRWAASRAATASRSSPTAAGPALLAADSARERGVDARARSSRATVRALDALLPDESARAAIRSTCAATRRPSASPPRSRRRSPIRTSTRSSRCTCRDRSIGATDAARAVAAVARGARKPVLGAWLGAIDRPEAREALEAGGIANFYTPENAVEAFSFLAAYRRHQEWLLEVPPPQPEPEPPDLAARRAVRAAAEHDGRTRARREAQSLRCSPRSACRRCRRPTVHERSTRRRRSRAHVRLPGGARARRQHAAAALDVRRAPRAPARCARRGAGVRRPDRRARSARYRRDWRIGIVVRKEPGQRRARELALGVYTDATFGPGDHARRKPARPWPRARARR